jgi:hypothetical protein
MENYNHPQAYEVFVSLNRSMYKDWHNQGNLRRMMEGEWVMTDRQYRRLLSAIENGITVIVTGCFWGKTLVSYEATDITYMRRKGQYVENHDPSDRGVIFQLREQVRTSVVPRKRKMNQRGYEITHLNKY